jgi:membrane-associated phospholipid phosphatase
VRLAAAVIAFAVASVVAAAMIALGVIGAQMHHFSDTIGGAAVGVGAVLATALVIDLLMLVAAFSWAAAACCRGRPIDGCPRERGSRHEADA